MAPNWDEEIKITPAKKSVGSTNSVQVETNRRAITTNRLILVWIFIMIIGVATIMSMKVEASLHQCEERLYQKITGQNFKDVGMDKYHEQQ